MRRFLIGIIGLVFLATLVPTVAVGAAGGLPPAPPAPAPTVADTPVGRQVSWLVEVSHRLPMSAGEAAQHFTPTVLDLAPVAVLNAILASIAGTEGLELVSYSESGDAAEAGVTGNGLAWTMTIVVDATGLIAGLTLHRPEPTSWGELETRLKALAPDVSFLVAQVNGHGTCKPVEGIDARTARPLGSAFKLYVLGALAQAVKEGRATWDTPLAIRDDWKSFPSGNFQDLPAGTELPLSAYADNMISISDNTAADHLIHFLGRREVEAQQQRFAMVDPRANEPFLTTRELFQLKLNSYPSLADPYEGLGRHARRDYLSQQIDPLALPTLAAPWTDPREIDSLEWFASPADICNAFSGLQRLNRDPALAEVGHALSINNGGIGLDPQQWKTIWFKGGSEPGVLTLNYLATTTGGRTFVVSVMASDSTTALDETTTGVEMLALAKGALDLAAG